MLDVVGLATPVRAVGLQEMLPSISGCELRLLFLITKILLICHDLKGLGLGMVVESNLPSPWRWEHSELSASLSLSRFRLSSGGQEMLETNSMTVMLALSKNALLVCTHGPL